MCKESRVDNFLQDNCIKLLTGTSTIIYFTLKFRVMFWEAGAAANGAAAGGRRG